MLRRLVCNGYFWLLLLALPLGVYNTVRPFDLVRIWPDTGGYVEMADMEITDPRGLATMRTWGFPVLLKVYRFVFLEHSLTIDPADRGGGVWQYRKVWRDLGWNRSWWITFGETDGDWLAEHNGRHLFGNCWLISDEVTDPWAFVPTCQLLLHVFSVLMFYAGLRQLDFAPVAGVLMCMPVMYFDYLDAIEHSLLADATGQAFLLLTVSSFFFVLRNPLRPLRWASLGFCVFASYHIRAAFQFLLVMLPLVAAIVGSYGGGPKKHRLALAGAVFVLCWLPYLAYCGLRYKVVGQFNLVSYTGWNFFGLCGQLFTDEMLPEVSDECKPLAEVLLRGRQEPAAQDTLRAWTGGMYYHDSHGWIPPLPHGRPVYELDYDRIQDQYSWLVWQVIWPWVWGHYRDEEGHVDVVAVDRLFLKFSLDFIRHHPDIYLMCMVKGWQRALLFLVLRWATRIPVYLFCAMLLLAAVFRLIAGRAPPETAENDPGQVPARERFKIFTWTAVLFFVFKIQLATMVVAIMMIWDIDGRYPDAASLLLPCLPMLGVYYLGRYCVRIWRARGSARREQAPESALRGPQTAGLPA